MTIKAVLFDIGNVMITWHPENLFRKVITDPGRRAFFLETVVPMDWHVHHDAGVSFADNRISRVERFPEYSDEILAFDTRFDEMLGQPIPETMAVIEELQAQGVPQYALTNMPAEKAQMVFDHIPAFRHMKDVVVSGVEKLIKPDPAIYRLALRRMSLTAPEVFFTDDSAANIEAANALGFVTHLFDRPETLRPALVAAGVLK
ncbi:HAD family hydrolase [Asticcacaulis solisilvae]|uniref:HAD family hydrolase n=1 Tax=Asticcacaulis solisilvae TaxID=1217274 RepID=UPI003FD7ED81